MLKFFLALLYFTSFSFSQNNKDSIIIPIDAWLKAGPIAVEMPVEAGKNTFMVKELLDFNEAPVNEWYPAEGEKILWNDNQEFTWNKITGSTLKFNSDDQTLPEIIYLAAYIENDRWLNAEIEFNTCHFLKAFVDGKEILLKAATQAAKGDSACKPEKSSKEIELERGKHILIVKALKDPKTNAGWNLTTSIKIDTPYVKENIIVSVIPENYATVEKLLEDPKIGDISISADGELAAVNVSEIPFGEVEKKSWVDIYRTSDGKLFQSFKGGVSFSNFNWAPKGKIFSYTTNDKKGTSVWIIDLDNGTSNAVLENVKDFAGYQWASDGASLFYNVTEKPEDGKSGLTKIEGMNERLPGALNKNYLYKVSIHSGIKTRITAGDKPLSLVSLSLDGKKALLSTANYDWNVRPYFYSNFYLLDLSSMRLDSLNSLYWAASADFSPDGKRILFTGGPSLFGEVGINVKEGMLPNDFDRQAFIYEIASGKVEPITKNFNPAIKSAYWSKNKNVIYFNTTDKTFENVYRYNLNDKTFTLLNLNAEIVTDIKFAANKESAVYKGSSATEPDKLFFVNLENDNSKLLYNPAEESFKNVIIGETEKWVFKNARSVEIDGLVYYPPNFDKNKKYPCIIFYYGGTTPMEQAFEGRYPRNIWTANGYVVYVLQPSGATGYGQQFSAYHVNDWGNITAQEIIDGTKLFLEEHPFVDPEKIGCIGASYGGFMTMNLLTKTDMFTAAISHAGISNLADYWGVGYWGYAYSAVATANSFPWNRKDIYVDYSPIYSADKINTPLLLLHGASDTNVPPGESTQMFTALKLLGRDVEYIQVADQDHHILEYKKRMQWTKTIIAYFDKYLKNQPQWWNNLYP